MRKLIYFGNSFCNSHGHLSVLKMLESESVVLIQFMASSSISSVCNHCLGSQQCCASLGVFIHALRANFLQLSGGQDVLHHVCNDGTKLGVLWASSEKNFSPSCLLWLPCLDWGKKTD